MKSFLEQQYKLHADPFDGKVSNFPPMAGREKEKKVWEQILKQRAGQRGNSFNFIIGDYGTGKSFTLYKIFEDAKNEYPNILPIFMPLLSEDTARKFGLDFIQRIFEKFELSDFKKLLSKTSSQDFTYLKNILHEPGIILEKIKKGDQVAFAFLRGDRSFNDKEMKALGIVRKIDSTDRAKDYLLAFLYLLKKANINSLLLAIDEVEYIFSQMRGAKISQAFATLRGIFDLQQAHNKAIELRETSNMIFFFGISEDGWRRLTVDLQKREKAEGGPIQPFMDRKDRTITLGPLSEKETKELIELRLKYDRIKNYSSKEPLIPFTEEFVKYVFKLTLGKPRDIVERCDHVLLDGLEQKIPLITVDFAKKVYASHGLTTEPKESSKV